MALGIGATATIASVVNGLLRPLPFRDPERLMMVWQRAPGVGVEEDWLSPAQYLYRHVLRGALGVVGIGIALGLAAALFASRLIGGLLYGVEAFDPLTLAAATALLLVVGLGASLLPARRAAGIDPVIALKE